MQINELKYDIVKEDMSDYPYEIIIDTPQVFSSILNGNIWYREFKYDENLSCLETIVSAISRDETYPFSYLVFKNSQEAYLLEVLNGDKDAWVLIEHNCGEPYSWKDQLPNGLYIVSALLRIKDCPGATDWNERWVEQVTTRSLTGLELLKVKRGESLCSV